MVARAQHQMVGDGVGGVAVRAQPPGLHHGGHCVELGVGGSAGVVRRVRGCGRGVGLTA
jgi:hypothetical protein